MSRKDRRNQAARLGLPSHLGDALAEVTRMRDEFTQAKADIAAATRSVTHGPVTATVNGDHQIVSLTVAPEAGPAAALAIAEAFAAIKQAQEEMSAFATEKLSPYINLADTI